MENKEQKTSIRASANTYEPKVTRSICELERIPVDAPMQKVKRGKVGQEFEMNVVTHDGEEYKVPDSVLRDLKEILKVKPALNYFKVTKSGSGLQTAYTVIPLD